MAAENKRDGSPMSIALVEGTFPDGAEVILNEYSGSGPEVADGTVLEKWVLRIDKAEEGTGEYAIRYLPPELEKSSHKVEIYTYNGSAWTRAAVRSSGSYTVFDASGDTVVFSAVETGGNTAVLIIAVCACALVLAGIAGTAAVVKKKRKAKAESKH